MNIVVRIDSEGEITLIGRETIGKVAEKIMREDFETFFWEKYESSADVSFEELYEEYAEDECCLGERSAWMHGCNGTDLSWAVLETACDTLLTKPLTMIEMFRSCNEDCYLEGEVLADLSDIINSDYEEFLDLLSVRLTGNPCLMDISYRVVDVLENNLLVISVRGDVSEILEVTSDVEEAFSDLDLEQEIDKIPIAELVRKIKMF